MENSEKFHLMLQLHSDNGGAVDTPPPAPVADTNTEVDTPPPAPQNASNDVPVTSNGERATVAIKVDPLTGRRQIVTFDKNKQGDTLQNQGNGVEYNQDGSIQQPENNQDAPMQVNNIVEQPASAIDANITFDPNGMPLFGNQQQEQPVSEPYKTTRELLQAISDGTVDENRIPMELAFQYAAYKVQVGSRSVNANGNDHTPTNIAQPAANTQQVSAEEARKQFYNRVEEIAHNAALQDCGLTEEQLAVAEYSDDPDIQAKAKQYNTAIAFHRQNVINNVQRKQMEQQEAAQRQQAFMQSVYNEMQQLRSEEKEFDQIDILMGTMYKQMPYDKAVRYASAIQSLNQGTLTATQADDLRAYYKEARTHYYATKHGYGVVNKPVPSVPKVENSGADTLRQAANGTPQVTLADLRNAAGNRKQSREILRQILIQQDARKQ